MKLCIVIVLGFGRTGYIFVILV